MLYPPIVDYSMSAFPYNKPVRVYFALSNYNSISSIAQVQVLVRYQNNNNNALDTNKYPNKIKCASIQEVKADEDPVIAITAARYYIVIDPSDLNKSPFDPDVIYKVQLRFSPKVLSSSASASTLASEASEWSTVCLLKPIEVPTISILNFDSQDTIDEQVMITYNSLEPIFLGTYEPNGGAQTLKQWKMQLFNEEGTTSLCDSGWTAANNYNSEDGKLSIECHLPYTMENNKNYQVVFSIETKNGFTNSISYSFLASAHAAAALDGTVTLNINEDDGYAAILTKAIVSEKGINLTLRRTSSKTSFAIWEDIANYTTTENEINWNYADFSIESGIFYQYGVQIRDNYGRRSSMITTQKEMGEFDSAFLIEKGESVDDAKVLKLQYDVNIANTAVNVGESKVDTIGSKYPYVTRNGNMYYHSFPLEGLITECMDNSHLFATKDELYHDQTQLYNVAYGTHILNVLSGEYDYTYERLFREKVEAFLYDNKPKLYKSLTEGNLLIKLMSITLTPKQELGRLIYSFSATAVEIGEASIENLNNYGIQTIGTYQENITYGETFIGQLNRYRLENDEIVEDAYPANFNLIGNSSSSSIETIYSKHHVGKVVNGIKVTNFNISYLRITIDSDPYLIKNENGSLVPFDDKTDTPSDDLLLGTLININGETILIEPPNNIYELKGENINISSSWNISPLKQTKMTLDYVISLSEEKDTSTTASSLIYKNIVGQLCESFASNKSIWTQIYQKYYVNLYKSTVIANPYYVKVTALKSLDIEANKGSIVYVKTKDNQKYQKMIIDESNELNIVPSDNTTIIDAYFYGLAFNNSELNGGEGMKIMIEPKNPTQLAAYNNGSLHIYYNGKWYDAVYDGTMHTYDIVCPVSAIVNYEIATEKGIY